jgi:hypothetical protein
LEAAQFVIGLPRRRQVIVLELADQIARHPFQIGDYHSIDANGRTIENLLLEGYLFTYWIDHGSREVRITEILAV